MVAAPAVWLQWQRSRRPSRHRRPARPPSRPAGWSFPPGSSPARPRMPSAAAMPVAAAARRVTSRRRGRHGGWIELDPVWFRSSGVFLCTCWSGSASVEAERASQEVNAHSISWAKTMFTGRRGAHCRSRSRWTLRVTRGLPQLTVTDCRWPNPIRCRRLAAAIACRRRRRVISATPRMSARISAVSLQVERLDLQSLAHVDDFVNDVLRLASRVDQQSPGKAAAVA